MSANLRLVRDGAGIELQRGTFDVLVDGTQVGTLEWRRNLELQVTAGHHEIQISRGRYSSRRLGFDLADGETADFQVHGAMLWPRYVVSLLKPDLAISLKHE